jgi:cell division protein FtsN
MRVRKAYSGLNPTGCMFKFLFRFFFIYTFLIILPTARIFSQELPEYDEIAIFLDIPGIGGGEIDAVIRDEEVYLPVTDLFNFLKIRNIPSQGLETISGFFIDPNVKYEINKQDNRIIYQDKIFNLDAGDLIRTESNLYLHSAYFGKVFGLECKFSFRSLSVTVSSKLELPLIREMRLEQMRLNLTRLKGEVKADTSIGRTYPWFKFGMADWSAIASEEINGKTDTRLNLSLGSMLAGGEMNASIFYNTSDRFTEKQQYFLWRYVNNDFKPLRQVLAGKIASHAISSIYNPVLGVQLTNTPTTYRRSFGSYTLTDITEPGWITELYVNNVLVDYAKADASGFFKFEVPLVYGNSIVRLKFYSPWGEERTREQNIVIPFNFLPVKTMEYTFSAGIVEDSLASRFSRGNINYGVSRNLTIGGGAEYLSSVESGPFMPYINASLRITNNLLLSGEYTLGVRARGTLSYRLPSNMQFDLNYTWYDKDQKAINYNYREERKAIFSIPLKIGKFSSYQRFSLYQIVLPGSTSYTTGEWLFTGSPFGVNTNLTTYALFIGQQKPYLYSNLSLAFKLPGGFVLMPQAQYGYTQNKLMSVKTRLEKHLLEHAFFNISYEQNFSNNLKLAEMGFMYDFSFAQTGLTVRQSNKKTSFIQYARGSLINDRETKYLRGDNHPNVGRGGISIVPYLDINSNGKKDPGEPKAYGLNLHTNGGRVEKNDRDTTIRILGLEPYTSCFIELDPNSFENISWRLNRKTVSVAVDPNILKLIEIPVTVAGEANGKVTLEQDGEKKGLGRIIVCFYANNLKPAGKTITEEDGFFSFFGLPPGNYHVLADTAQLRKLGMVSDPELLQFSIKGTIDGDIATGLDFTLRRKPADTTAILSNEPEKPVVRKDTTYMVIHEVVQELVTIAEDSWAIQLGAFKRRSNAEAYRRVLEKLLGRKVDIVIEDDFFKVRIPDLKTREEVDKNISVLKKNRVTELWVIRLKAKQQQWILTEKQDTVVRITETITPTSDSAFNQATSIELGKFKNINDALALKDILFAEINKPILIVRQDGLYKVRIIGFVNRDELIKFTNSLDKFGIKEVLIPPLDRTGGEVIKVQPPEEVVEKAPVVKEPSIALQVGIFHNKLKALRAKRRITSKLHLPVEIVLQWDSYHVIITGFFTREETYMYFPELAALGYPGVSLIENYKKQQ